LEKWRVVISAAFKRGWIAFFYLLSTTTFCVAISSEVEAMAFNGRTWNSVGSADPKRGTKFVSHHDVLRRNRREWNPGKPSWLAVYNGHSWSSQKNVSTAR